MAGFAPHSKSRRAIRSPNRTLTDRELVRDEGAAASCCGGRSSVKAERRRALMLRSVFPYRYQYEYWYSYVYFFLYLYYQEYECKDC